MEDYHEVGRTKGEKEEEKSSTSMVI